MWLLNDLLSFSVINMSLRQIRGSYFHLTNFSLPLLFFIYYYLINDLIFWGDFFFKTLFVCLFVFL